MEKQNLEQANPNKEEKLEFIEFETKYRVEGDLVYQFKRLAETLEGVEEFIYIESDDIYYVDSKGDFARYRYSKSKDDKRAEVTWKVKPEGATNNIRRLEINWRVDETPAKDIEAGIELRGFKRNFRISKIVHIYRLPEVTLPFYTVIDETGKMAHFIEIEVREDLLHNLTEEQAWEIIKKYEAILAPLGISAQKRLRKSLFEMYKR